MKPTAFRGLAAWALMATGHPLAAAGLTGASAVALTRRAGEGEAAGPLGRDLAGLAVTGTIRAGPAIATAVRRAWLPPAAVTAALSWRIGSRSARRRLVIAALAAAVTSSPSGLPLGGIGDAVPALADDLAYQTGLWKGVIGERAMGAPDGGAVAVVCWLRALTPFVK